MVVSIEKDSRKRISELFLKYNFRSTPVLDQFFLIDQSLIARLLRYASISKEDTVLEIGPGLGFITEELAKNSKKVIAVEKDKRLEPILRDAFGSLGNVELIFADALEIRFPKFDKIVSNIPYSISSPLTFKLLDYDFKLAVLLYQREFGEKMMSKPGDHEYGRLSVMVGYYFDAMFKEIIPRNSFYPQPQTDACVVTLSKKQLDRDGRFDVFVRELFRYKNKNVRNAVKLAVGKDIVDDRKVDYLTIEEIRELYSKIK